MDKLIKDFRSFHRSTFGQGNMSTVDQMIMGQGGFKNMVSPYILEERELHCSQLDIFSRLMLDRIIFFGGEVTAETSNIVVSQLLYLENTDPSSSIKMYINSPGGDCYSGLGVIDVMNYVEPEVSTINTGLAASMGAMLLMSGTKGQRKALQHSRTLIHQPLLTGMGRSQASDIEIEAKEILKLKDELYQIIVNCSNMPMEEVIKRADRDHWLTASEALQLELVDEVITKVKK